MLDNRYSRTYERLVDKARCRVLEEGVYFERHHVIPRSLGGGDDPSNLVNVTAREHFIAHLLLTKCYEGQERVKMLHAFGMMSRMRNLTSGQYEACRKAISEARKNASPETLAKMSESQRGEKGFWYGKNHSEETKLKMSVAKKGKRKTSEHAINISKARKGMKFTEEHKAKISSSKTGVKWSEEHKAALRERMKLHWVCRREMYGETGRR